MRLRNLKGHRRQQAAIILLSSAVAGLLWPSPISAAIYSWTPTAGGNFTWDGAPSNWTSGFPNAPGDVATFNTKVTNTQTIVLGQPITIGTLNFLPTGLFWGYSIGSSTSALTFDNNGSDAALTTVDVGSHTATSISPDVHLADNLVVGVQNNDALTISGRISETVAGRSLKKLGNGTLVLTGSLSYTGDTSVGVAGSVTNGGILILSGPQASIRSSIIGVFGMPLPGTLDSGSTLNLDFSDGSVIDRIKDSATVTLGIGGQLTLDGAFGKSSSETIGALEFANGTGVVTLSHGITPGSVLTLTAANPSNSIVRTNNAVGYIRANGSLGVDNSSVGRVTLADAGASMRLVGTTAASNLAPSDGTLNLKISTFLFGGTSLVDSGSTFVTYDTGLNTVRALTTSEFAPSLDAATGADQNVRAIVPASGIGPKTINSLLLAASSNMSLTGTGGGDDILTINSGVIFGAGTGGTISGFDGITLKNGEGVIGADGIGNGIFTVTISSPITITDANGLGNGGSLTKFGGGSLVLAATENYTGGTQVDQGTLMIGNGIAGNLAPGSGAITLIPGTTLALNMADSAVLAKDVVNNGGTVLRSGTRTSTNTLAGIISGTGGVAAGGSGVLVLSNSNTYTGGTQIGASGGAGVLRATSSGALGTGPILFDAAGGTPGPTSRLELSGGISLANPTINLFQRNNTSDAIRNLDGTNILSGSISIGAGGTSAAIESDGGLLILSGPITNGTAITTGLVLQGIGNGVVSSTISNSSGNGTLSLTKQGTGTWTLSGSNSYTGATTVAGGKLRVDGSLATTVVSVNKLASLSGGGRIAGPVSLTSAGASIDLQDQNIGTLTLAGGLTLNNGAALSFDVGSAADASDSVLIAGGAYTFNAGVAAIHVASIGHAQPGSYNLISGANGLNVNSFILATTIVDGLSGNLSANGNNLVLNLVPSTAPPEAYWTGNQSNVWSTTNSGHTNFDDGPDTGIDAGSIPDGNSNVHFSGQGTSGTSINTTLGSNFGIKSLTILATQIGSVNIAGNNSLSIVGDQGIAVEPGAGTLSITVTNLALGTSQTWSNNSTNPITVSSNVLGTGALTKSGVGVLTLAGTNTYSGGTTLNAGQLNANSAFAFGAGTLTINAGTIDNTSGTPVALVTNAEAWLGNFTFSGSNDLGLGTGSVTISGNGSARSVNVIGHTLTVGSIISASLGLTKTGAGTLTIAPGVTNNSAPSNIAGDLCVSAGVLSIGANSFTATGLVGFGTICNGSTTAASLIIINNAADRTFSGVLQDGGIARLGLTKQGAGTLRLEGSSSYSGPTSIVAGTLVMADGHALGAGTVSINNAATLDIQTNGVDAPSTVTEPGGFSTSFFYGSIVSNRLTDGPAITHVLGTLNIGTSASMSFVAGSHVTSGTPAISFGGGLLLNGTGIGTSTLNPVGATVAISGGSVSLNRGAQKTLELGGAILGNSVAVPINDGNGTVSLMKSGTSSWTLTASNSYTGGTTVLGGLLTAQSLGNGTLVVTGGEAQVLPKPSPGQKTGTTVIPSLQISGSGSVDLTNNALVVDYVSLGSQLTDLRGYLAAGSLNTSLSAGGFAIGYADNATLGRATWGGVTIDSTSLLAGYTYAGDANLDGVVNALDFNALANHFGTSPGSRVWVDGDFNYDGVIDSTDFTLMAQDFNASLTAGAVTQVRASALPVPEPSILLPGAVGLMSMCRKRLRHFNSDILRRR